MAFLAAKYSFWQPTSREEITRQLIPFQEMTSRFYAQAPVCRNGQRAHENSSRPPLVDIQYVQPPDWLYITSLDGAVQEFYAARSAKSTRAVYRAGQKKFVQFCFNFNVIEVLPVTQEILCFFVSYLGRGVAHRTIKNYLAAIRNLQISYGFPSSIPRCIDYIDLFCFTLVFQKLLLQ